MGFLRSMPGGKSPTLHDTELAVKKETKCMHGLPYNINYRLTPITTNHSTSFRGYGKPLPIPSKEPSWHGRQSNRFRHYSHL
ncbi:hypothetical protein NNRS527_02791 [Nitrosospira sp. NRS527]|nr:hypothetical protein NNRS527_02791 [Nitrosospira sp. NRS527]